VVAVRCTVAAAAAEREKAPPAGSSVAEAKSRTGRPQLVLVVAQIVAESGIDQCLVTHLSGLMSTYGAIKDGLSTTTILQHIGCADFRAREHVALRPSGSRG
jgi:hypothetical protein